MFLTDSQWDLIGPHLEIPKKSKRGRPRANARQVFEAILFVLHTGTNGNIFQRPFLQNPLSMII